MTLAIKDINKSKPLVGILLCTYNGEKFLDQQLKSIAFQTYENWRIFASDDGSIDRTVEILKEFRKIYGSNRIIIFEGSNKGVSKNFLFLIRQAYQKCEYLAFCDQDDIWYKEKLSRSIDLLSKLNSSIPSLYCSSTSYISEHGEFLRQSYVFKRPPSFQNALVQSIAGGNTMLFNRHAANLLIRTPTFENLVAHDWWTYIIISGFNGQIYYDRRPSLAYRQHPGALVGENQSIKAKIIRIKKLLNGTFKDWIDKNLDVIIFFMDELPEENQKILNFFIKIRSRFVFVRVYAIIRSGVRRQTLTGNLALLLGVILNKI